MRVTLALLALVLLLVLQPRALVSLLAWCFPKVLFRVPTSVPLASLSFDDGPDAAYTPQVLSILAKSGARATFFLIGERAALHADLVRRIREGGHEIGNHYRTPGPALWVPPDRFEEDLLWTEAVLSLQDVPRKLFRPPSGLIGPGQLAVLARRDYRCVLGSAYPYDPSRPPAAYIVWLVRKNLRPGAIVVLHDAGGDRSRTVRALQGILLAGRKKGLGFVPISELLSKAEPGSSPSSPVTSSLHPT